MPAAFLGGGHPARAQMRDNNSDFEAFWRQQEGRLLAYCQRVLGDWAAAEDVTQALALEIYRGWDQIRLVEGNPAAYAKRRARWRCLDWLRKKRAKAEVELNPESAGLVAAEESAEAALLREEELSRINGMPAIERIVVKLRHIEGYSYAEIAEETKLSISSVKAVLEKGLGKLRQRLEGYRDGR